MAFKKSFDNGHSFTESMSTFKYAANRVSEIKCLLNAIKNPSQTKLVFQSLPKHMRRRAMSHNPNRLPHKFRQAHKAQMRKSGAPVITKRPSRKFRRKPGNLMKEYIRRQKKNVWLETHLWHAKRFHMVNRWGYRLPYKTCNKTYRMNYRASVKHCLMQDISYYGCIELSSTDDSLRSIFSRMTNSECGLGVFAKTYLSGYREGITDFFKLDKYPYESFGRISFMWKPTNGDDKKTIWFWVHPSIYESFRDELIKGFSLILVKSNLKPKTDILSDDKQTFVTRGNCYNRSTEYKNEGNHTILIEFKDTLNRIRLTGSRSTAILKTALKTVLSSDSVRSDNSNWYNDLLSNSSQINAIKNNNEYWNNLSENISPAELHPNLIIGLVVEDPRTNRPKFRSKVNTMIEDENNNPVEHLLHIPDNLSNSYIWNCDIRNRVTTEMKTTLDLIKARTAANSALQSSNKFEKELQPIPIILVQRPGVRNKQVRDGFGSGWDVIIPSGYGTSFWISFIMWGAKPGGLKDFEDYYKELVQDEFLPDTISGISLAASKLKDAQFRYFRLPPNKRTNYFKLSIASPFQVNWSRLLQEWSGKSEAIDQFFVIKNNDILEKLQLCIKRKLLFEDVKLSGNCLIPVRLTLKSRGNPGNLALICVPKKEDLRKNLKFYQMKRNDPVHMEPTKKDPNERKRKSNKFKHSKELKRLRRRRVRIIRQWGRKCTTILKILKKSRELSANQFKEMCELWLPSNPSSIRRQCTREVIGYVTQSDFNLTQAKVTAAGYVTAFGFKKLISTCSKGEIMPLIRGTKSRCYRFASMSINT